MNWTAPTTIDGNSYPFNADTDVLNFGAGYHANKVVLANAGVNLSVSYTTTGGTKTITLQGMSIAKITTTNFTFADGSEILVGSNAAETLPGTDFGDQIYGQGGNDVIGAGAGSDLVFGGGGNDKLDGGAGVDTLVGGLGNDSYTVDVLGDVVTENGGEGSDTVTTLVNNDTLDANVEAMVLGTGVIKGTGNSGDNVVTGNALDNSILGAEGNDSLVGGAGNDLLDGGIGDDTLNGGANNDTFVVDSALDMIVDSAGTDTVKLAAGVSFGYALSGASGAGAAENLDASMVLVDGLAFTGNARGNVITGGAKADSLVGMDGNDSLVGGKGVDTLIGGDGNDTLDGGLGADKLRGGAGDDTYVVNANSDVITETTGIDKIVVVGNLITEADLPFLIENLDASGSTLASGMTLVGSGYANAITGSAFNDTIQGAGGDDSFFGGAGDDSIVGGDGNESLDGGTGNDVLVGGYGNDTYVIDTTGDVVVDDPAVFFPNGDTIKILGNTIWSYSIHDVPIENLDASGSSYGGGMHLDGNDGPNIIIGSAGNDTITGYAGASFFGGDSLAGGAGADSISGSNYGDTLDGGGGNDTLKGGDGDDVYVINALADKIQNETSGNDTVRIGGGGINSYTLSDTLTLQLENVDASASTFAAGLNLTGNGLANEIAGSGYADLIKGMAGSDEMHGGAGNDTIYGSFQSDGDAAGGAGQADTLDGGAGDDLMLGGYGNDTYVVDTTGDVVGNESTDPNGYGGGVDTVRIEGSAITSLDLATFAGGYLEHIDASGSSAAGLTLNGNAVDNSITGSDGNDTIQGGAGADSLAGGYGDDMLRGQDITHDHANDTLNGGFGADTLAGGYGSDTYLVDNAGDTILGIADDTLSGEQDGFDTDVVRLASPDITSYTLQSFIEDLDASLVFDGTGIALTGNASNNNITGTGFADTIAGGAGADVLTGAYGDDTYVLADADTINEDADAGTDTVQITGSSLLSWTLDANIERIDASAAGYGMTLTGNAGANTIVGTGFADTIAGGDGADSLAGGGGNDSITAAASGEVSNDTLDGGYGDDILSGGYGDDDYIVNSAGDSITGESGGNDTVTIVDSTISSMDLGTYAGGVLENVDASGSSAGSLTLVGNGAANSIVGAGFGDALIGSDGSDTLDGGGGNDTLDGGYGDDIYVVDSSSDSINEANFPLSGTDTVRITGSSIASYDLGAVLAGGGNVENLDASDSSHVAGLTLTGTAGNNSIVGSSFADTLSAGGSGSDTVDGGGGNDTINGTGTSFLFASGGAGDDSINGSGGNDSLDGGTGDDTLMGQNGDDTYYLDSTGDVISNELGGTDTVIISGSAFGSYTLGAGIEIADASQYSNPGGMILTGNTLGNSITGTAYGDVLDGGLGVDNLYGGYGGDLFIDYDMNEAAFVDGGGGNSEDTFRFSGGQPVSALGNFSHIDRIDMATDTDPNQLTGITDTEVVNMSDNGVLFVDGGTNDFVSGSVTAGTWTFNGEINTGYYQYALGTATVNIAIGVQTDLGPT